MRQGPIEARPASISKLLGPRVTAIVLSHSAPPPVSKAVSIEAAKHSPCLELAFKITAVFGRPLEEVFQ